MKPCECQHWARPISLKDYPTNHHPNCVHYNDSLIDVWVVSDGVSKCVCGTEEDARETAQDSEIALTITKEKMHEEVLEHAPDFDGF